MGRLVTDELDRRQYPADNINRLVRILVLYSKVDLIQRFLEAVVAMSGPLGEQTRIELIQFTKCMSQMPSHYGSTGSSHSCGNETALESYSCWQTPSAYDLSCFVLCLQ